ncbi:PKD domain-containing protein [Candidatus Thiosymbion oneisti]|uniref:PKD domain-containing protein n=1 Tax=Candidatus Thiosymbion oneisti TaxID=589554 RepID=UPI000A4FB0C6|nr:PKD domain-containing protein [Candidatus Thiosymbion oneisti]
MRKPILLFGYWALAFCWALSAFPVQAELRIHGLEAIDPSVVRVEPQPLKRTSRPEIRRLHVRLRNVSSAPFPADSILLAFAIKAPEGILVANAQAVSAEGIPYFELNTSDFGSGRSLKIRVELVNEVQRRLLEERPRPPGWWQAYRKAVARWRSLAYEATAYYPSSAPIADAGADSNALTDTEVKLDGSASYDPGGGMLRFGWATTGVPAGSTAALNDPGRPDPTFVPDVEGDYVFALTVDNGQAASVPDQVTVSATHSDAPPNADAGRDQEVPYGATVTLDGTGSDDPNGLPLTYSWSFTGLPGTSALTDADITDSDSAEAGFMPDALGTYSLDLRVDNGSRSDTDGVSISVLATNVPPVADAGTDRAVKPGEEVTLDGSLSRDPDSGPAPITYRWSLVARPSASNAANADIADAEQAIARFTPDVEGGYIARIEVDDGEYQDGDNTSVFADGTPPTISITAPVDGAVADTLRPNINVTFDDDGSGIDTSSFTAQLNGVAIGDSFAIDEYGATYQLTSDLSAGLHTLHAAVQDKAGNLAQVRSDFRVSVFRALPEASPTTGPVPLTVNFTTNAEYSGGAILRYRWDFQGDGIFDTNDPGEQNYTHTYTSKGVFDAVLEVLNDQNETAVASVRITITGNPPAATASIDPSNGQVPLTVNFTGVGSDADGRIVLYEWDFEGDGVFDFSSTTTGSTSHTYPSSGTFNAVFRVTDNDGLTAMASATATAVRVGPRGSPTATITSPSSPVNCNAPCSVSFNGTGSDGGGTIVQYEWDLDGDGVYDASSPTSASTNFTYSSPGLYVVAFRVIDNDGLTGVDTIEVKVTIDTRLELLTDTCSAPVGGSSVDIRTRIGGTTPVTIFLKNKAGDRVRTLVNRESRAAGSYTDTWDCTADTGVFVTEGVYFAVLEYEDANGQTRTLDESQTSGGQLFNPSWRMEGSSCSNCQYVFQPLEDDFLDVDMTLTRAAEVTVSVRVFRLANEVVRLMDRRPLGRGLHHLKWDGADAFGNFAHPPPGRQFIFGVTAFTLPNNGIFVEGAPRITNFSAEPNYFDPATPDFLTPNTPTVTITFDVSKDATAVLQVFRAGSNRLMKTISQPVSAGTQTVEWNGRNEENIFVDKGDYRLALKAIDTQGNQSLVRYMRVRVFY